MCGICECPPDFFGRSVNVRQKIYHSVEILKQAADLIIQLQHYVTTEATASVVSVSATPEKMQRRLCLETTANVTTFHVIVIMVSSVPDRTTESASVVSANATVNGMLRVTLPVSAGLATKHASHPMESTSISFAQVMVPVSVESVSVKKQRRVSIPESTVSLVQHVLENVRS